MPHSPHAHMGQRHSNRAVLVCFRPSRSSDIAKQKFRPFFLVRSWCGCGPMVSAILVLVQFSRMQSVTKLFPLLPRTYIISSCTCTSRTFSVFPPTYIHPIFRLEDQEKLKTTDDFQRHTFLPVRPAQSNQTASVFYDPLVAKFINHIMRKGNKLLARGLLENTFTEIKRLQLRRSVTNPNVELNPYKLLHLAVKNARPLLHTTPIKRGGHTYQVPVPIRTNSSLAIALEWLIEAGKEKDDDIRFYFKLAREIVDAAEGVGKVIKRKQDLHRLCEANRAYAHYRWS